MTYHSVQVNNGAETDESRAPGGLRIAYITMRDSNDRRSWSGTLYNMGRALERHCGEVFRICPLEPVALKIGKLITYGARRFTRRTYLYTHTVSVATKIARMAEEKLSKRAYDVIFAPVGSGLVAHLQTSIPVVYLSDTTTRLMVGYNWEFTGLVPSHVRTIEELERAAIGRADQLVYPSHWAAQSAEHDYRANPSKIHVVPFGANLDPAPSRKDALRPSTTDRCRLLFVGVNWQYKGGDIAFETLLELERLGVPTELTVLGCCPPAEVRHPHLRVFPFLNKNDARERAQLDQLYREANFFILPTRAECFSIALCEANAFGIPVLSTQTGGLPDLVRDGINGFLFPLEARGDQYAARIRCAYGNTSNYQGLRASSREQFETRLNWDSWGKAIREVLSAAAANCRNGVRSKYCPQPSMQEITR